MITQESIQQTVAEALFAPRSDEEVPEAVPLGSGVVADEAVLNAIVREVITGLGFHELSLARLEPNSPYYVYSRVQDGRVLYLHLTWDTEEMVFNPYRDLNLFHREGADPKYLAGPTPGVL